MHAQDTAELFFDNVRVPVGNLLGEEGKGFVYLMQELAQERCIDRGRPRPASSSGCWTRRSTT